MLKRNLLANYLGQGWIALMGFAFIPLYIRFIGIEAYGLIGLFAVVTAWLSLLDMGMTPTLAREMARFTGGEHTATSIRDLLRTIETIALMIAILFAGVIALSSQWLANSWLRAEELPVAVVAQAFSIMGMVTALRFIEGLYRSSIVGLQRQVLFNTINGVMATLRGFGAVAILAWVSPTIQAFFLWQGLISIATLSILAFTIYNILPRGKRPGRFSWLVLRNVWQFAGGMMGITFLALLLTKIDKILLARLLTLTNYGYYTLAASVAGALYMLVSPITQAWFPRLTQLYATQDSPGLIRTYHQGAQLVTVTLGSTALVLIVFSETFLQLWTQNPELVKNTAPLLRLLVLGNLLNGLMWIPYQTQLAHGWTKLTVCINIVSVLLIVPAIFWATPRYGAVGAAWVWVSLNLGYVLIGIHFMYRRILKTEKWRWYRQDVLYPLLAALAVATTIGWILPDWVEILPQLATLTVASICTFTATVLAANRVRERAWLIILNFLTFSTPKCIRK
ncbi:lipopolysaccharide biosynthesis protein [Coleofasciculus chthonoplastes]|uniref:lipopolysaccharide biosynthesis protein n=1 Tax=Coleofasciculus chthonoplastes TaxID=64178 RepID=UPI0032FA8FFC